MEKRIFAIRGAVCAENTAQDIQKNVQELFQKIFSQNNLSSQDVISIIFSVTDDLDAENPATALRKSDLPFEVSSIPLFCVQEPKIKNSPKHIIRTLVTAYMNCDSKIFHIYMNGAENLRKSALENSSK